MAPRRVHSAAIAAGSDGSVLINIASSLPAALQARLAAHVGGSVALFVGVPLGQKEAQEVVARLDGAAAEASAHLLGRTTPKGGKASVPRKQRLKTER